MSVVKSLATLRLFEETTGWVAHASLNFETQDGWRVHDEPADGTSVRLLSIARGPTPSAARESALRNLETTVTAFVSRMRQ